MSDVPPPPPAGGSMDPKQAKADAKAATAHAKALRPWYKKKRFILGGLLILLIGIGAVSGGGDEEDGATSASPEPTADADASGDSEADNAEDPEAEPTAEEPTTTEAAAPAAACKDTAPEDDLDTKNQDLYPDRPDRQGEDHEVAVGDCARLAGYTAYVEGASVQPQEFGDSVFVVNVRLQNRDDDAQSYNLFDWSLLTPAGTIVDPTFTPEDTDVGTGDLVKGGEVAGTVPFAVTEPGTYYVIYTPGFFSDARAIWQVTI